MTNEVLCPNCEHFTIGVICPALDEVRFVCEHCGYAEPELGIGLEDLDRIGGEAYG